MRTLPELIIAPAGSSHPSPPDPASEGVETWREQDGSVCAVGRVEGDERWFWLLGVGSFRFAPTGGVMVIPEEGRNPDVVRDAYRRSVLPLVLQSRGLEVLHASAVRAPRGVVALCAVKETGKTTLAYALGRRGHPLWADDAVVVDATPDDGPVLAHQLPFAMRLRPASAAFFGHAASEGAQGRAHVTGEAGVFGDAVPLAGLYVLVRDEAVAEGAEVRPLAAAAALTAVLAHAYCFTLEDAARKGHMVAHYLALVSRVPVYEVRFATGLDRVPAILDAVERTFGDAPLAPSSASDGGRRAVGA